MLIEAMDEQKLGRPWEMTTDIGPVIDEAARARFTKYIANSDVIHQTSDLPDVGHFIQPTLIRVNGRADVKQEIFGPVLHVAKFDPEELPKILAEINASDYALTFGLHARIANRVDEISQALRVGNIYVNRNQIGAVVGSQPFGGSGLSGTGPKAGGPEYLPRFLHQPTVQLGDSKPSDITLPEAQSLIDAAPSPTTQAIHTIDCPGPTGESNRLSTYARGKTLCLGPNVSEQIDLVTKAGGTAVALDGLSPSHLEHLSGFSGVVCWADEATQSKARRALAKREGPILPLATGRDLAWAVTTEIHVCIDTTASGGNTALLAGQE